MWPEAELLAVQKEGQTRRSNDRARGMVALVVMNVGSLCATSRSVSRRVCQFAAGMAALCLLVDGDFHPLLSSKAHVSTAFPQCAVPCASILLSIA